MDWDRFLAIVCTIMYSIGIVMIQIYGETFSFILLTAGLFFSKKTDWKLGGE
jgi:hypothetical protein